MNTPGLAAATKTPRPTYRYPLVTGCLIAAILAATVVLLLTWNKAVPHLKATLLTSKAPFSAAIFIAQSRGYFSDAGIDVTVSIAASGKDALAILSDGQVDFATAAETPIMLTLMRKNQQFRILATLAVSHDISLVCRQDRKITTSQDLAGKNIGFAPGTTSQYFLDTFLDFREMAPATIMRTPMGTDELLPALLNGSVDAIAAWTPINFAAMDALGENGIELTTTGISRWSWNLAARNDAQAQSPETLAILRALARASEDLEKNPTQCAQELAPIFDMPADKLLDSWSRMSFNVNLGQTLLLTMEQQARWALANGLAPQEVKEVPNFLAYFSSKPLRLIKPSSVTLIDGQRIK